MTSLRVIFVGGAIAYRGLFNWIHPAMYVPAVLGAPLFQILFFTYLGRFSGLESDGFFVVGNALQACGMASIYGTTMVIANERWFGTLGPLLATPARRLPLFLGRALPFVASGFLVSAFGLAGGHLLLAFDPAPSALPALALIMVVTVTSCTAFGLLIGSWGLAARDSYLAANLAYFLMLLVCGTNVPLDALPAWLRAIGNLLPVTHGVEAARAVADGRSLASVSGALGREALVGFVYAVLAYTLFRFLERDSRRRASLQTL